MQLENYISEFHPEIADEYKRFTTPFYYEPDVIYYPITNGFNCGTGGNRNRHLKIVKGDYFKKDTHYTLVDINDPSGQQYGASASDIHTKLKRLDESIAPVGRAIPNSKRVIYVVHEGIEYTVIQAYWRNYNDKRLGGRITVSLTEDDNDKKPYYEFYSCYGSSWCLKHVTGYDCISRENYTIKFKVSVREFKRIVFGSPDVKIKLSN